MTLKEAAAVTALEREESCLFPFSRIMSSHVFTFVLESEVFGSSEETFFW